MTKPRDRPTHHQSALLSLLRFEERQQIRRASYLITFCRDKLRTAEEEVKKVIAGMEAKTESETSVEEDLGFLK